MLIDRWTNLNIAPAYLAQVGPRDREVWRVLLFPVAWIMGGLMAGAALYALAMSLSDYLSRLMPAMVQVMRAAPLGRVHVAQVKPHLGLLGEARSVLQLTAGPIGFAISIPVIGHVIMRRPMHSWFTAAYSFRWKMLAAGMVLFCLATGVAMILDGLLHGFPAASPLLRNDETWSVRLVYFIVTLVAITGAAAAEEAITRGWLMQQTSAFTRNLAVIVSVNAALFSLIHLDPDPLRNLALFISGVSLSLIAVRTGGLEFGIGIHAANNLMLGWFSTPFRISDPGGRMTFADLLVQVLVTLSGLALAEVTLRWRPLRGRVFWDCGWTQPRRHRTLGL